MWLTLLPAPIVAAELGGSLGASSDNIFRGLSQSDGQPSLFGDAHLTATPWFIGLSAESVRRDPKASVGAELIIYGGYQQAFGGDWSGAVEYRHYDYPGSVRRSEYNYDELSATLSWRDRVALSVIGSPDTFEFARYDLYGRGAAFAFELTDREQLPSELLGLSLEAGVGYYDLQQQVGAGYAYWDVGLSRRWRSWQLGVRYIGSDSTAHQLFGALASDRAVASVLWLF